MSIGNRKFVSVTLLSWLVAVISIGCSSPTQSPQSTDARSTVLLVAAAASLQPALTEIKSLYVRSGANRQVNYNFGSSGTLQQQIAQGAPVDVFISAASSQMNKLNQQNLILPNTRKNLLTNQLVLITPSTAKRKLTDFRQLTQPEIHRIAIGEPNTVPAGQYAIETLTSLGILQQVKPKFVLGNNVRSVLASVATGDADAGFVYRSDVSSSGGKVAVAALANNRLHSPIVYPIAIIKSSKSVEAARNYLSFLQTKPALAIFKKYGFDIAKS